MFESQGTTPEFQGNPESGIDQFLNQSNTTELTIDQLKARIAELEAENGRIAELEREAEANRKDSVRWFDVVMKAREQIEEILAGHTEQAELVEAFEEPFTLLGVSMTRTVQIEISATWRGTIELPLGVEVEDLDIDDFNFRDPEHNEYESSIGYYGMHDYSIEER